MSLCLFLLLLFFSLKEGGSEVMQSARGGCNPRKQQKCISFPLHTGSASTLSVNILLVDRLAVSLTETSHLS